MKKRCYIVALALALAACTPPKSTEQKEAVIAPQALAARETPGIAPITLAEAATYIANFINHPDYGTIARKVAVGGAFTKEAFQVPPGQGGALFWYCANKTRTGYPEFFLALDHIPTYDSAAVPKAPAGEVMAPDYTFTYTEPKSDEASVTHFLETLQHDNQRINKIVAKDQAEVMISEFRTRIEGMGHCETDNCKYPLGYFDAKQGDYMNLFMANMPTMVRYFYGYDTSYSPNSIRIILIGTDEKGKNILSFADGDVSILQKSVPPPPIY